MRILDDFYGKDRWFIIVSFTYLLYVIFPLFGDLTNIQVFIPSLLVVTYIVIFYNEIFSCKPMRWLVAYVILLFLYSSAGFPIHINGVYNGLPAWWRITIESAWIMPSVMIAQVLYLKNNTQLYRLFGIGSFVLVAISFLYILPLLISSRFLLRESIHELTGARPIGIPDYGLMHAYSLMLVPLCYCIKNSVKKPRIFAIGLFLLFFYVITQTAVTTSLFVSSAVVIFSVMYSSEKKSESIFLSIAFFVGLYILYEFGFFLWLVDFLMPLFDGSAVSPKLQNMHDSMIGGRIMGGSLIGRMNLHQISLDSFFSNPIIGGGQAGGHSKILDLLGCCGLVVFVPFIMTICCCLKQQLSQVSSRSTNAFICLVYFAGFIFLFVKGIFGAAGFVTMLVIVPSALISLNNMLPEELHHEEFSHIVFEE